MKIIRFKAVASQWSFGISMMAFIIFILLGMLISDSTLIYYILPFLLIAFVMGLIGLTLELSSQNKKDKKLLAQSLIAIFLSLLQILLLGYIYIAPLLFPFGIPPM